MNSTGSSWRTKLTFHAWFAVFSPYEIDCNLSKCNVDINHVPVINVVASEFAPKNSAGD